MRIADDRGIKARIVAAAHVHDASDAIDRPAGGEPRKASAVERVDRQEEDEDGDELGEEHRHETARESPPLRGGRIEGLRGRSRHLRFVHH